MSLLRSIVRSSGQPSMGSWTVAGPSSRQAVVCSLSPAQHRTFSCSTPRSESIYKRNKRANEKRREESVRRKRNEWYAEQPDPYLGVKLDWDANGFPLHEQRWRQTKLSSLILDPHTLWTSGPNKPKQVFSTLANANNEGAPAPAVAREEAEVVEQPQPVLPHASTFDALTTEVAEVDEESPEPAQQLAAPANSFPIPRYLSHRLPAADREFLFRTLPKTAAAASVPLLPTVNLTPQDQARRSAQIAQAESQETPRLEAMARILSLRNASAAQIKKESIPAIVAAFGQPEVRSFKTDTPKARKGPDTGSMEVQIAILTMKIRALRAHLVNHMQDHSNARQIKIFATRRKKCFEYLKRVDPVRYQQCLMECGIDKRSVEGELVVHRWWRQVPVRLAKKTPERVKYVGRVGHHRPLSKLKRRVMHPKQTGGNGMEAHY